MNTFKIITSNHVNRKHLRFKVATNMSRFDPYIAKNWEPQYLDLFSPLLGDHFKNRLEGINDFLSYCGSDYDNIHPLIKELEEQQRLKVGPNSIKLSVPERLNSIRPYFKSRPFTVNETAFTKAVNDSLAIMPKGRLRPCSLEKVFLQSPKNTQQGYPFPGSGEKVCRKHLSLTEQFINDPCVTFIDSILFWRGQASGHGLISKNRTVFGQSHSIVYWELMFQIPLLESLLSKDEFSMWTSIDRTSEVITKILDKGNEINQEILSFDASGFDMNMPRELIYAAFYIIKSCFQKEYHIQLDCLCIMFCEHDLVIGRGGVKLTNRNGAIPSGSGLTNLVGSIINLIVTHYIKIRINAKFCMGTYLGDDAVILIPGLTLYNLEIVTNELGIICNPSKQAFGFEYADFCQRRFIHNYRVKGKCPGIRSAVRTLGSMFNIERPSKLLEMDVYHSCRYMSQLEECRDNPLFHNLIDWTYRLDRLNLGVYNEGGPSSLFREFGLLSNVEDLTDKFKYTSLFSSTSSIVKLEVVKYLNKIQNNITSSQY